MHIKINAGFEARDARNATRVSRSHTRHSLLAAILSSHSGLPSVCQSNSHVALLRGQLFARQLHLCAYYGSALWCVFLVGGSARQRQLGSQLTSARGICVQLQGPAIVISSPGESQSAPLPGSPGSEMLWFRARSQIRSYSNSATEATRDRRNNNDSIVTHLRARRDANMQRRNDGD